MTEEKLKENQKVVMFLDSDLEREVRKQAQEKGISEDQVISEAIDAISEMLNLCEDKTIDVIRKIFNLYEDKTISKIIENRSKEEGLTKTNYAKKIFTHILKFLKSLKNK